MKKFLVIIGFFFCLFSGKAQYTQDIIVQPVLKTDTTAIGQKIVFPSSVNSEVTISKIIILPGKSTGWHKHGSPVFAYVLKGTLSVEVEHGKTNVFREGTAFSEVVNVIHNGSNQGKEDVVLLAFYLGEKGKALSEHK